ncbi:hypothetical protein M3O48_08360 [Xanthomonas nasturtii]|nr:hypothetical protein [Xanthomonas nasturtii]
MHASQRTRNVVAGQCLARLLLQRHSVLQTCLSVSAVIAQKILLRDSRKP